MSTIRDLQQGMAQANPPQMAQRKEPNEIDWWNVNSGLNLSSFSFSDSFDENYNFILPFYIDKNVKQIIEVGLTLYFQPFRAYSIPGAHTHEVTIPSHSHTIAHTHDIPHTHDVSPASHTHSVPGVSHSHSFALPITGGRSVGSTYQYLLYNQVSNQPLQGTGSSGEIGGQTTNATTPSSTTSGGGASTTVSSGASSATSSGASNTASSGTVAEVVGSTASAGSAVYGIYQDTYPSNVGVLLDGTAITANLGGPWDPSGSDTTVADLDLTGFFHPTQGIVEPAGLHVLELTSDQKGRAIPLLWVKSIISR